MRTDFFLYIRVSTDEQDPIAQKLEAEKIINKNPIFKITKVYEEKCSAWSQAPTNLVRMIKDIENIHPDQRPNILVKCVDRFSRNMEYGMECLLKIISLGIEILFFDTPNLNVKTPEGLNLFSDYLRIAQMSSDTQSCKIKESIAIRKENGIATTSVPVFGTEFYKGPDDKNYFKHNEQEIMILAIICMLNGRYTNDHIMRAIRVYEKKSNIDHTIRTMYDYDFVKFSDRHKVYFGTDKTFAEILNYFNILKRGENWTPGTIRYQWTKNAQPKSDDFEKYIQDSFLVHNVPEYLLIPSLQTGSISDPIYIGDTTSSSSDSDSDSSSSSSDDSSDSDTSMISSGKSSTVYITSELGETIGACYSNFKF